MKKIFKRRLSQILILHNETDEIGQYNKPKHWAFLVVSLYLKHLVVLDFKLFLWYKREMETAMEIQ